MPLTGRASTNSSSENAAPRPSLHTLGKRSRDTGSDDQHGSTASNGNSGEKSRKRVRISDVVLCVPLARETLYPLLERHDANAHIFLCICSVKTVDPAPARRSRLSADTKLNMMAATQTTQVDSDRQDQLPAISLDVTPASSDLSLRHDVEVTPVLGARASPNNAEHEPPSLATPLATSTSPTTSSVTTASPLAALPFFDQHEIPDNDAERKPNTKATKSKAKQQPQIDPDVVFKRSFRHDPDCSYKCTPAPPPPWSDQLSLAPELHDVEYEIEFVDEPSLEPELDADGGCRHAAGTNAVGKAGGPPRPFGRYTPLYPRPSDNARESLPTYRASVPMFHEALSEAWCGSLKPVDWSVPSPPASDADSDEEMIDDDL